MKEFIPKDKKALTGTVLLGAAILIFFVLIYIPQHRKVGRLKNEIRTIDDQIELTKTMLGDLNKLGHVLAGMQQELSIFEKRLPEKKQVSSILSELSRLAKSSSLEVVSIKPERPLPVLDKDHQLISLDKSPLSSIKVELSLKTHYKALAEYVRKIQESLNILATIDGIIINNNASASSSLNAEVVLTVYVIDKG